MKFENKIELSQLGYSKEQQEVLLSLPTNPLVNINGTTRSFKTDLNQLSKQQRNELI